MFDRLISIFTIITLDRVRLLDIVMVSLFTGESLEMSRRVLVSLVFGREFLKHLSSYSFAKHWRTYDCSWVPFLEKERSVSSSCCGLSACNECCIRLRKAFLQIFVLDIGICEGHRRRQTRRQDKKAHKLNSELDPERHMTRKCRDQKKKAETERKQEGVFMYVRAVSQCQQRPSREELPYQCYRLKVSDGCVLTGGGEKEIPGGKDKPGSLY